MRPFKSRIAELDFLRGLALVLMLYVHLVYDLKEFYDYPFNYQFGINYYLGKLAAFMFIIIAGFSCSLSTNNFYRASRILAAALLITISTYFFSPEDYINFGILHFLGLSILLYPLLKNLKPLALFFLALASIIIGFIFQDIYLSHNCLLPLGITTKNYISIDYYPLFPYISFFLFGIIIKNLIYPINQIKISFPLEKSLLSKLGRHSLFIYLIHQPFFLFILYLLHRR